MGRQRVTRRTAMPWIPPALQPRTPQLLAAAETLADLL
jgi:hypothetical protein